MLLKVKCLYILYTLEDLNALMVIVCVFILWVILMKKYVSILIVQWCKICYIQIKT